MRKRIVIFLLCSCLYRLATAQMYSGRVNASEVPAPAPHFEPEYTSGLTLDTVRWLHETPGLHVSFGSTGKAYLRNEVPDLDKETLSWTATGWRGERLNTMIVVWSPDTLNQVRFTVNDLTDDKGNILSKDQLRLRMVRYVLSNYPYGARDVTCGTSPYKNAYLMPDRLEAFDRFDLQPRTARPVWLSLDIPAGTPSGIYRGRIGLKTENSDTTLNVQVRVQHQLLPPPHVWKFRLDLWQNPWVVAWYNHVKPWSPEHKAMLKKHLRLYADAGGKYITTYAVHSPWADNSYRIEETMIQWIRQADGSWKFDYSIFDQYVQLAMEAGIDKAITIYTPLPWGNRFRYLDAKTGNYVYAVWSPESKEFRDFWSVFLTDLAAHLKAKGWFEKTYLGINENELNQTLAAIRVIKDHPAKWKITYAGNWHPELDSLLDDYSFVAGEEPSPEKVKERSARGFTSTYYVCCNPPKPNNFVFSPPVEGRWISWYAAAYGYDGFLRWAYDAWPADPMRDARHFLWPAGDCFLVYPGAESSVRFEKLREGISDYEKIRILRQEAARSTDKNIKGLMKAFDHYLQSFIHEKEFSEDKLREALGEGRNRIEVLSDKLSQ